MEIKARNLGIEPSLHGKVCVIDGDLGVQHSLSALLRTLGAEVVTFSTAEQLLARVSHGAPAFLITELKLPGMGGFELQEELARRGIPIPIIGLTGDSDSQEKAEAARLGFLDLVEKPFVHWSVVERVQQALHQNPIREGISAMRPGE